MNLTDLEGYEIVTDTTDGSSFLVCNRRRTDHPGICQFECCIEEQTLLVVVDIARSHSRNHR